MTDNSPMLSQDDHKSGNEPMLSDSEEMQEIRERLERIKTLPEYMLRNISDEQLFRIAAASIELERDGIVNLTQNSNGHKQREEVE